MKKIANLIFSMMVFHGMAQVGAPIAVDDTVEAYSGIGVTIYPFQNDSFADGTPVQIHDTLYGANNGTVTLLSYTPDSGFVGNEVLTYVISNPSNPQLKDTGNVLVNVKAFPPFQGYGVVEPNNVQARIYGNGFLFTDLKTTSPGYFVPKESKMSTIFSGSMWLGGKDANGSVHVAAVTYQADGFDFYSGPVMDSSHYIPEEDKWNRVWRINRQQIEDHKMGWYQPQYTAPEVILNWPAHGDASKGQAANLAPFTDVNNNGIYEPMLGDFPHIKGDEAVYFIYNDDANVHTESGGAKLGVEVHGMAYGFSCSANEGLNTTLFFDYKIINRSQETYHDMLVGFFQDFDIGGANDDYMGCDVGRSTYYAYNGDNFDADDMGNQGYGTSPPAQGFTVLSGVLQDSDGIDNAYGIAAGETINGRGYDDGIVDNERRGLDRFFYFSRAAASCCTDPYTPADFYNYLNGVWKDGVPMTYGGTGHNDGTVPARYMFPGDTDPLNFGTGGIDPGSPTWTEQAAGNSPADRRGIGSMGPFTFEPGEEQEITVAYVFADSDTGDQHSSVALMQQYIDEIKVMFEADSTPCHFKAFTTVEELKREPLTFKLYPNPTSGTLNLEFLDGNTHQEESYEIYDMTGRIIEAGTIRQSIDVSSLNRGLYFVRVGSLTKRFVKE